MSTKKLNEKAVKDALRKNGSFGGETNLVFDGVTVRSADEKPDDAPKQDQKTGTGTTLSDEKK